MLKSLIAGNLLLTLAMMVGCANQQPEPKPSRSEVKSSTRFPVLKYSREEGDQILLNHELTSDERELFRQMDAAVAAADNKDDIGADYAIVETIGADHGLTRNQAIAFWTRTTFSMFEPDEFDPNQ